MSKNPWNVDHPVSYAEMWLGAYDCVRYINQRISGDENIGWLPYILKEYISPALGCEPTSKPLKDYCCLILGSSEGHIERTLCENGFIGQIVASDIADKAFSRVKNKIDQLGYKNVTYIRADLNQDSFDGQFDFIIAEGVLHHIANIEQALKMIDSILLPGGLLLLVEYEGPVRFQLPELQV